MTNKTTSAAPEERNISEMLRKSSMFVLMLIFVGLYAAAFFGKFDPLKDNAMLLRFEPIIFLLIGYYFGRLPSRQNEQSLKDEIARQAQKTDAAQYAKEKVLQEREMLEEKIKNVRTTIGLSHQSISVKIVLGILDS